MKLQTLLSLALLPCSSIAAVYSVPTATGFASDGSTALSGTPTDGLQVYDNTGTLIGNWAVQTGQSYTDNADRIHGGQTTSTTATTGANLGTTQAFPEAGGSLDTAQRANNRGARITLFDDTGLSNLVVSNEVLNMSITSQFGSISFNLEDGVVGSYESTIFASYGSSRHNISGATEPILATNNSSTWTGTHTDTSATDASVGAFDNGNPSATRSINTTEAQAYDGTTRFLLLSSRYDIDVVNSPDNTGVANLPTVQYLNSISVTGTYSFNYDAYTFTAVPEPSSTLLMGLGAISLCVRRR